MSFSPEVFKKKLDALQETQDSIVSISQWVLFHHRHATHLCELWAEYTLDPQRAATLKKKLLLLYLCNDVVQQARHKRKPEFSAGFAPLLPLVIHAIYGSVDDSIKPKIERLISVWSQRNVFTKPQIHAMDRAVHLLKESTPFTPETDITDPSKPPKLAATSGPQIAADLVDLNRLYTQMTQLIETSLANLAQIGLQTKTYLPDDPSALDNLPLPKVYVSKLNVLEKLCHMTVQNLEDAKKTRTQILASLALLTKVVSDAAPSDDTKTDFLLQKLAQILETRGELLEMIDEPEPVQTLPEEPSPAFESASPQIDSTDNLVPTYEDSSDESDAEPIAPPKRTQPTPAASLVEPKKRKLSGSSIASVASKKSVAFSEEIEVKEYERDDQPHYVDIAGDSVQEHGNENGNEDDDDEDGYEIESPDPHVFELHHKDAVELMDDHKSGSETPHGNGTLNGEDQDKGGLLSLLSKLN